MDKIVYINFDKFADESDATFLAKMKTMVYAMGAAVDAETMLAKDAWARGSTEVAELHETAASIAGEKRYGKYSVYASCKKQYLILLGLAVDAAKAASAAAKAESTEWEDFKKKWTKISDEKRTEVEKYQEATMEYQEASMEYKAAFQMLKSEAQMEYKDAFTMLRSLRSGCYTNVEQRSRQIEVGIKMLLKAVQDVPEKKEEKEPNVEKVEVVEEHGEVFKGVEMTFIESRAQNEWVALTDRWREEEEIKMACIRAKEGAKKHAEANKRLQKLYDERPMITTNQGESVGEIAMKEDAVEEDAVEEDTYEEDTYVVDGQDVTFKNGMILNDQGQVIGIGTVFGGEDPNWIKKWDGAEWVNL